MFEEIAGCWGYVLCHGSSMSNRSYDINSNNRSRGRSRSRSSCRRNRNSSSSRVGAHSVFARCLNEVLLKGLERACRTQMDLSFFASQPSRGQVSQEFRRLRGPLRWASSGAKKLAQVWQAWLTHCASTGFATSAASPTQRDSLLNSDW